MPFSLLDPLSGIPLAIVDVETTGASAEFGDRVVEIGLARVEGGQIVAQYERLVNPQRRISAGVTALTGITNAMCEGQPTFAEQLADMLPLMRDAVVVGHNIRFDLSFLRKEFRRAGIDIVEALSDAHVIDTVRIARKRFGRGGNGLQRLCRNFGYEPAVAHRALADVITTHFVLGKLMEPVGGWGISLCDCFVQQGGRMGLLPINARESLLPLELEEALEQRCAVVMEYLDAEENRTNRVIEPIQIRRLKGELMLIAHCRLRNERRHFKLERIVRLTRMADLPEPPPTISHLAVPAVVQPQDPSRITNNT